MAKLKYFVLQYMPNIQSGEFLNVGLVLLDVSSPVSGFCGVRFAPKWEVRVQSWDSNADISTLRALFGEIENKLSDPGQRGEMLRLMEDSFSNAICLSPWQDCPGQDATQEVERLASTYLGV